MAITNWNNFIAAGTQEPAYANLFENVLKGYKMQQEPAKMKEEQSARQLANQLKKMDVEHKPTEYALSDKQKSLANALAEKANAHYEDKLDLENRYKESQITKNNRPGGNSALKPNADVANEEYIWNLEHPGGDATPEDRQKHLGILKNALAVGQESKQAKTERTKQIKNSAYFTTQPAKWKDQQFALAAGLGIPSSEASKAFIDEGKTVSDLAREKGIDPKDIVPVYPMANENIKQTQIRSSLVAELMNFEKNLSAIQGKYSRKLLGYSPKQIVDAIKNENPKEQGLILAARYLAPEIAAIRAKIAVNGTIGIEALRELTDKALSNMKIFEPLVSEEAKNEMNKQADRLIMEAQTAYQNKMQSYSQIQPSMGQQAPERNAPDNHVPLFKNEAEMRDYYKSLSPEEKIQFRRDHGASR